MRSDHLNYALEEAASNVGCVPSTAEMSDYLRTLEYLGLVRQSHRAPIWFITEKGQTVPLQIRRGRTSFFR